jgi:hypothetical protein
LQSVSLGIGKALPEVEARRAQLLEGRERELHLPLDSDRASDVKIGRCLERVLEQSRLADARLAVDGQDTSVASPCSLEHAVKNLELALPADQLHCRCPRDHPQSMPLGSRTTGFRDSSARLRRRRSIPETQLGEERP